MRQSLTARLEGTDESKLFFSHYGTRKSDRCVSMLDVAIYAAGERGDRVLLAGGEFSGLDRAGRALIFQQPPLVRPQSVGTLMPPVKGLLDDYRCRLIRIVEPYSPEMAAIHAKPQPK